MKVEEAILTALSYERKVRDHYADSKAAATDPAATTFFKTLAEEEQGHVDYLEAKLEQWRSEGSIGSAELTTACPHGRWLETGIDKLREAASPRRPDAANLERLHTALRLEQTVSDFYRDLVATLADEDARGMFRRFLEIEDGHTAVVQAEIDFVSRTGCFFDVREFTLDG